MIHTVHLVYFNVYFLIYCTIKKTIIVIKVNKWFKKNIWFIYLLHFEVVY
jgi:hypothetical protein